MATRLRFGNNLEAFTVCRRFNGMTSISLAVHDS